MRYKYILFLFSYMSIYLCVLGQNKTLTLSISETRYTIEEQDYYLVKGEFKNVSENDFILWIDSLAHKNLNKLSKEDRFNKYMLKSHGDFNLLNLIFEGLLCNVEMNIFKTFLKKIAQNESFVIILTIKGKVTKLKIETCKSFLNNNVLFLDKKKSDLFGDFIISDNSFFKGNSIVIPFEIIDR